MGLAITSRDEGGGMRDEGKRQKAGTDCSSLITHHAV
jgi:hypothetical protein